MIHFTDWRDRKLDPLQWDMGNAYLTKEEAEKVRDIQRAIVKVNDAIDQLNKGEIGTVGFLNDMGLISPVEMQWDYGFKLKLCATHRVANQIIKDYKPELELIFGVK